jgi:glycosyltransferase involved in cell wall biosynthesis
MLEKITPVVLTLNEEANIGRTLDQLKWARDVVVVDSFSADRTVEIASKYPNVRLFQHKFEDHSSQWNYAVKETDITAEWILALDADYFVTRDLIEEMTALVPLDEVCGFSADFRLCVFGRPLRSSIYPPVTVLFRREQAGYVQDGHTQRVMISGGVGKLRSIILHDDRKPIGLWFDAQRKYSHLEAKKLRAAERSSLGWADKVRCLRVLAPFAMFSYCFFWRLGFLDGLPGAFYAFQRTIAEMLLSLCLIEEDLRR